MYFFILEIQIPSKCQNFLGNQFLSFPLYDLLVTGHLNCLTPFKGTKIVNIQVSYFLPFYLQTGITMKVISGIYPGVTTVELDTLAAETAATMTTKHPDYAILAARIAVSNLHKETKKSFSGKLLSFILALINWRAWQLKHVDRVYSLCKLERSSVKICEFYPAKILTPRFVRIEVDFRIRNFEIHYW